MKKLFVISALCAGILSLNQFALANGSFAPAKKEAGYISLNSSKTIEVDPNIARITFTVENTAQDAQKASYDNNVTSNEIIKALKLAGNASSDVIATTNFVVRPIYATTKDGKKVIKNYMAANSITVETKNINNVSKLIDTAIASGANRTDGLYYLYDNEKSACTALYPQLLKDLKTQANTIAQSIGSSVDGIKIINASCNSEGPIVSNGRFFAASKAMDEAAGAASTPVESGKVKIRVFVNADFYVK